MPPPTQAGRWIITRPPQSVKKKIAAGQGFLKVGEVVKKDLP